MTTFTFTSNTSISELPAHLHSAPHSQNVKLQVWNNQTFTTTQSHSTINYHRSHSGLAGLLWNNIDSNGYLWFLGSTLPFAVTMVEDRKIGYGRIVAEGQQAVDLAAFQRLEAPVHSVRSDRPSDQTNEPTRWTDSQTTACCKREGWVGFQTSQISVAPRRALHSWHEPVNWFTKEQEIWTVTTFTFASLGHECRAASSSPLDAKM